MSESKILARKKLVALATKTQSDEWIAIVDHDAALRELIRHLVEKADVPDMLVTDEWRELVKLAKAVADES